MNMSARQILGLERRINTIHRMTRLCNFEEVSIEIEKLDRYIANLPRSYFRSPALQRTLREYKGLKIYYGELKLKNDR